MQKLHLVTGLVVSLVGHDLIAMQAMKFVRFADRPPFCGTVVPREDFFKNVMASTSCPDEVSLKNFLAGQEDGGSFDFQADMPYQCGTFELCSIQDLQDRCTRKDFPGGGTFNVVEGIDTKQESWFRHHVDIGALQADPDNRDAVFQVASNFNGLETVDAQQNIDEQFLEHYIYDRTQGPSASISAAPGLIARHYFMYYNPETPRNTWPQTVEHHVNFLDALEDVLPVSKAGYVVLPEEPCKLTQDSYGAIKIGFHANVQVTHGFILNSDEHLFIAKDNQAQIINQVFTAAIDLGNTNYVHYNNPVACELACHILNAAYEGTLRKAFVEGKKRVFLTLVGGGVFGNDLSWIFDAISRMSDFIQESGLEVTLIWYCNKLNGDNNQVRDQFAGLVKTTGGQYDQFRHDGVYQLGV